MLPRVRIERQRARLALVQREVDALRGDLLVAGQVEELPEHPFRALGLGAAHAKASAAAVDAYVEPRLEEPQVLIERPAQIREPGVVRWTECEFPLRLGR